MDLDELDDLDDCTCESESVSLASDIEVVAEVAFPRFLNSRFLRACSDLTFGEFWGVSFGASFGALCSDHLKETHLSDVKSI